MVGVCGGERGDGKEREAKRDIRIDAAIKNTSVDQSVSLSLDGKVQQKQHGRVQPSLGSIFTVVEDMGGRGRYKVSEG